MKVWINGRVCDEADARVSPFDHGLLTGDGVFETLKVYGGQPFAVGRHLARLVHSATGMGLTTPADDVLRGAINEVIAANALTDARLRITLTGGPSPLGSDRGTDGPLVVVAAGPLPQWPATVDVVVVPWPRNERGALAGLKTTSYGENVVALAYAKERGAGEAIFGNLAGNVCEGTGTNIFVGIDGRLLTPPLSSGCLAGVTRACLLEITGAVEEDLPLSALERADEVFLSSTTREVQPVGAIDGTRLSHTPGPLTTEAAEAFTRLVQTTMEP